MHTITVSGYSDKKISKDSSIEVLGSEEYSGKTRSVKLNANKENIYFVKVRLFPGINTLKIKDTEVSVFYNDGSEGIPYAFSQVFEHSEPACDNCHYTNTGFSEKLTGEVNEVCNECHDQVKGQANIHPGYEDSSCIDCHDPHFSRERSHLVEKMQELCYGCHEKVTEIKGAELVVVHPPVELGECARCHDPHASDNEYLLYKPKYDLCTTCHPEPRDYGHADEYDDCGMCHESHRAERFLLLKNDYWENCLDCHDDVADQLFKHQPKGRGCGDCHDPHSDNDLDNVKRGCKNCHKNSDPEFSRFHGGLKLPVEKCLKCHSPHNAYNKRLLKSKLHFPLTQAGNCVACHAMQGKRGRKIGWIVERSEVCFKCHGDKKPLIGYDKSMHPPVLNGDCIQCHSPHLKLEKAQILLPIDKLCFKCHEDFNDAAKKMEGGSIHLPAEERDCLVCHNAHKSEYKYLLESKLNDLCFDCHYEKTATFEGRELIYYHDPPTEDRCTKCHEAHISEKKNLLK